jgi:hypothetical protein
MPPAIIYADSIFSSLSSYGLGIYILEGEQTKFFLADSTYLVPSTLFRAWYG